MKLLIPIAIADANLVSSSVPETDYTAWASGTTYSIGQKCISTTTHRIYESTQNTNLNHDPTTDDGTWWLDIAPTNRWAMFDSVIGTVTSVGTGPITVTVDPLESYNMLALLDLVATSVQVEVVLDATTIYDKTYTMDDRRITGGWWGYFFEPLDRQSTLVVEDLPPFGEVTVTINGTACGTFLVGREFVIGKTLAKPKVGIVDYSKKDTDTFGNSIVVKRSFAKRYEADVICDSVRVDGIATKLAEVRATPTLYIGDDRYSYESLLAYGFYKDFNITIAYPNFSECALTVESLI